MARAQKWAVIVEGGEETAEWLNELGDEAASIIGEAVAAGGDIVLKAAQKNAPVRTGNLKSNIQMNPVNKRSGKTVRSSGTTRASVTIGFNRTKKGAADDAYYGAFPELGTKFQKAQYYLRDAMDRNKIRIALAVVEAFNKLRGL